MNLMKIEQIDNFKFAQQNIKKLKKTLDIPWRVNLEDSLFYLICYVIRYQKLPRIKHVVIIKWFMW